MKTKRLQIRDLKVASFVTALSYDKEIAVKGKGPVSDVPEFCHEASTGSIAVE